MMAEKATKYTLVSIFAVIIIFIIASIFRSNTSENKEGVATLSDQELSEIVFQNAPTVGSPASKVVVIEFGDFECPSCKVVSPIVEQIRQKYENRLGYIWVHTPNPVLHPQSNRAALAAQCAFKQNRFLDYHDELFLNQDSLSTSLYNQIASALSLELPRFQNCLQEENIQKIIDAHREFAKRNDITSTPTLFINDKKLEGVFTFEDLDQIIASELQE